MKNFQLPITNYQLHVLKVTLALVAILMLIGVTNVSAEVMSSPTYKMQSDSVNFGGGNGSSASFVIEDTAGEVGTGNSASAGNAVRAGFQQTDIVTTISTSTPPITPTSTPPVIPPSNPPTGGSSSGSRIQYSTTTWNQMINDFIGNTFEQSHIQPTTLRVTPVVWVASTSNPFINIPMATNIDPRIAALTLNDFDFLQDGNKLAIFDDGMIAIDGTKNLTVRLDYDKVPEILKTVAFTLTDPTDPSKVFPFVLRVNPDKSAYEATIGALGRSGNYEASVVILDYQNQGLKKLNGSLLASVGAVSPSVLNMLGNIGWQGILIGISVFLLIALIIFMSSSRMRGSKKFGRNMDSRLRGNDNDGSRDNHLNTLMLIVTMMVTSLISILFVGNVLSAHAAFNPEINYQGKLFTNNSGTSTPVDNGIYNVRFALYTAQTGGSSIWNETATAQVTDGLFSYMLGSASPLSAIDFNQTLYLGVEIGGIGAPAWDGEMTPRKRLGAVPAAFVAEHSNTASSSVISNYSTNSGTSTFAWNANNSNTASTSDYSSNAGTSTYSWFANNSLTASTSDLSLDSNLLQGFAASDFLRSNITTDNLSQGILNKYYSSNLFATDLSGTTTDALRQGNINKYYSSSLFATDLHGTTTDALTEGIVNHYYRDSIVQTFLDTLNKGYFFATSSADYWKSQNDFFATSSADVWDLTKNRWSTSTADIWDLTKNRWATSTSDAWLALKSTDDLSQGILNKYYSTNLFAVDLHGTTTDALSQGSVNKYYSTNLFATDLYGTTTDALSQGLVNKYYSDSLFAQTLVGTTTSALAEGTNKYYTDDRARNALSSSVTALPYATTSGILSLDSNYFIPLSASTTAWNSTYNTVNASSTNWTTAFNTVNASSTNWTSAFNTVNASSTFWDTAYINRISSASLPLSFTSNTLSIALASSSANGYLSSTDWSTFNNKVSSQWTTLSSNIYFSTGSVGIGSTTPGSKLSIHDSSGLAGTNPLFTIASSTSASAATTTLFQVLGNGNVGIGVTNPTYKFMSAGTIAPSSYGTYDLGAPSYAFRTLYLTSSVELYNANGGINAYTSSGNSKVNIANAGPGVATLTVDGSVGIGSTTPSSRLSIHDSSGSAGTNPLFTIASSTSAGAATTTLFQVLGNGLLTINAPSNATSTINGNLYVNGALRSTSSYNGDIFFANNFRIYEADLNPSLTQSMIWQNQRGQDIFNLDENGNLALRGDVCSNSVDSRLRGNDNADNVTCFNKSLSKLSADIGSMASSTTVADLALKLGGLETSINSNIDLLTKRIEALESIASTSIALASSMPVFATTTITTIASEAALNVVASKVGEIATSTSFIQTIATAVQNIIETTGNWVVDRFTARIAYIDRLETKTICLGSTCIDEDALKKMMLASAVSPVTQITTNGVIDLGTSTPMITATTTIATTTITITATTTIPVEIVSTSTPITNPDPVVEVVPSTPVAPLVQPVIPEVTQPAIVSVSETLPSTNDSSAYDQ